MLSRILMATVAALALTVPAVAQDQATPPITGQTANPPAEQMEQNLQDEGTAEGMAAEQEAAPPAQMAFLTVQDEAQVLASGELIGTDVHNIMDEPVGEIADLVMDQDYKLDGVVLSVGGFLGIGQKWVAVPMEQIELPGGDQPARLLVAVTEEQLTNAPDFVTRATVEAQEAAEQAQGTMQQQVPPPTAPTQ